MGCHCLLRTYTLPHVKQRGSGKLPYNTGSSTWCSVKTERSGMGCRVGGRFKEEGTCVYLWLIHAVVWQKPTQRCKSNYVLCLVAQSCPTLCNPMDCSLPCSSVHGDTPGKNTGVGCHALLRGIFPTQGLNQGLLHCRRILYQLSYQGSPQSNYTLN